MWPAVLLISDCPRSAATDDEEDLGSLGGNGWNGRNPGCHGTCLSLLGREMAMAFGVHTCMPSQERHKKEGGPINDAGGCNWLYVISCWGTCWLWEGNCCWGRSYWGTWSAALTTSWHMSKELGWYGWGPEGDAAEDSGVFTLSFLVMSWHISSWYCHYNLWYRLRMTD